MNPYKNNTNEEMSVEEEKAITALNELLMLSMSGKNKATQLAIWEQVDILSAYIFKSNI
jgi:hypothetical protein